MVKLKLKLNGCKKLLLEALKTSKIFLITSLLLGLADNVLTYVAIGLGFEEGSPLHHFLGTETVVSWLIALFGPPVLILLSRLQVRKGYLVIPHIVVGIQLLNVALTAVLVRLVDLGRLSLG